MTALVIKNTGTTGSTRIEVDRNRRHDRVRIITANHGGISVFISMTPAEARKVAEALLTNAAAIEAELAARRARFEVGTVVKIGKFVPFMLRSDGRWISAGLSGPEHEEIVDLIAEAELDGTLEVLYP